MKNELGEIRRSSVIQTFGPGAIIDFKTAGGLVSSIHTGLEEWDESAPEVGDITNQKVFERRLMNQLGKSYFRLSPVISSDFREASSGGALVGRRFPEWLQCPTCSRVRPARNWMSKPGDPARYCASCSEALPGKALAYVIPTRFVVACTSGHLEDFPWHWWVKHSQANCVEKDQLVLEAQKIGLDGIVLTCKNCSSKRSLGDIFSKLALKGLTCKGRRPWLRVNDKSCECSGEAGTLRVLQRAGSNMHYPVISSALDIPPWTSKLMAIAAGYWDDIAAREPADRVDWINSTPLLLNKLQHANLSVENFVLSFNLAEQSLNDASQDAIKTDEFNVFVSNIKENDREFALNPQILNSSLKNQLRSLAQVPRLREIRVIKGFTRINPPFEGESASMSPISDTDLPWLPAMELRGEGIFFSLDSKKLKTWSEKPEVISRYSNVDKEYRQHIISKMGNVEIPERTSPTFFLLHSLSHLIMDRLTFFSGYGAASLRERLYISAESEMAGILIYTGTPDSDGTLGGLQSQGQIENFTLLFEDAIRNSRWCPSDPICMHGDLANASSFSLASCHSCIQVPETSCEFNNLYLDRCSISGDGSKFKGFFEGGSNG